MPVAPDSKEAYDLVVVGGGISGLAAAWFYRRARPGARILILDNHDDFGGHAKRNEFTLGGPATHRIWRLGIDPVAPGALQPRGERSVARSGRRDQAIRDRIRTGPLPVVWPVARTFFCARGIRSRCAGARRGHRQQRTPNPWPSSSRHFPLSEAGKIPVAGTLRRHSRSARRQIHREKLALLKATSYRDFLTRHWGCSAEVADCFQGRPLGYFGLGATRYRRRTCVILAFRDFAGLDCRQRQTRSARRALHLSFSGRQCVAGAPPGSPACSRHRAGATMDDVVLAKFDYGKARSAGTTRCAFGSIQPASMS